SSPANSMFLAQDPFEPICERCRTEASLGVGERGGTTSSAFLRVLQLAAQQGCEPLGARAVTDPAALRLADDACDLGTGVDACEHRQAAPHHRRELRRNVELDDVAALG